MLELDWRRFTLTIGALMMGAVQDNRYNDEIIVELKLQNGLDEPIERVPKF
jgi:hypothetical protein